MARPPLPNSKENELTVPGDNAKFLQHALSVRNLPPIDRSDPVQVKNRIDEYFQLCAMDDIKPTVSGFLSCLRVPRTTLWEWKHGNFRKETHQAIILEAYEMLEQMWEHYMLNGKINPVAGIFLGKNNFGYQDKQEYVLTPKTTMEQIDPLALEQKYAELPPVEEE